ncbi:response regulator [Nocardioides pacificus]
MVMIAATTSPQNATIASIIISQPPQPIPSWYQPIIFVSSFPDLGSFLGWCHSPLRARWNASPSCEDPLKVLFEAPGNGLSSRAYCHDGVMTSSSAHGSAADPRPPGQGAGLRAMVVEDEASLAALVASYLERAGFEVTVSHDGAEAVSVARHVDPDVVVLDLGLPGLDGIEVCRRLRTFSDCYVVMLTARTEEVDTLIGLSVGADDYITKPFSPRELIARIQAMMRRPRTSPAAGGSAQQADSTRVFGSLHVDPVGRDVWCDGEAVALTRTEFDLLATLSARPQMAFSRAQLIEAVWGPSWVGDEHLVDVHIGHLRRKIGDDANQPRFIRTVRGVGYRMGVGA